MQIGVRCILKVEGMPIKLRAKHGHAIKHWGGGGGHVSPTPQKYFNKILCNC